MFIGRVLFKTFERSSIVHMNIDDGHKAPTSGGVEMDAVSSDKFSRDVIATVDTLNNRRVW